MDRDTPVSFSINKAKITLWPIRGVNTAVLFLGIKAGSYHEPEDKIGTAHLLEHLTAQISQGWPTPEKMESFVEEHGLVKSASVNGEMIAYVIKFTAQQFKSAFRLLEEMVFYPRFSSSQVNREIQVVLQELNEKWNSPYSRFWWRMTQQLNGKKHFYSQRTSPQELESVQKLTPQDLSNFYLKFYHPQNIVIGIAGNLEAEKIKKELAAILQNKKNGSKPAPLNIPPSQPGNRFLQYRDKAEQPLIVIHWRTPRPESLSLKERFALKLGGFILGGYPGSLLFQRLRHQLGLVYSVESSLESWPTTGYLTITTSAAEVNLKRVMKEIKNTMALFCQQKFSPAKFRQIKRYASAQIVLAYDSVDNIARAVFSDLFNYGRIYPPEQIVATIDSLTPKDIKQTLIKHLGWEKAFISILLPSKNTPLTYPHRHSN